jgi:hypothetical protein
MQIPRRYPIVVGISSENKIDDKAFVIPVTELIMANKENL